MFGKTCPRENTSHTRHDPLQVEWLDKTVARWPKEWQVVGSDHPPLPQVNIITYFPLRASCCLWRGVGGQFPRKRTMIPCMVQMTMVDPFEAGHGKKCPLFFSTFCAKIHSHLNKVDFFMLYPNCHRPCRNNPSWPTWYYLK